jgi:hypothetical protein
MTSPEMTHFQILRNMTSSTYAKTADVIFPPYHVTSAAIWGGGVILLMIVRNCSDCPYFEVGVAEQNTGEHVIKLDIKAQNMATVYQCVKCKVLFKDLQGVSLHTCLSLIKPKDLQAPLSPLTVQIRHQAQIKVKNELIPAQQVRLNLLSRAKHKGQSTDQSMPREY